MFIKVKTLCSQPTDLKSKTLIPTESRKEKKSNNTPTFPPNPTIKSKLGDESLPSRGSYHRERAAASPWYQDASRPQNCHR